MGCCPAPKVKPKPKVYPGGWGKKATSKGCMSGLVVETGNLCCWPGQGSTGSACVGPPECPSGYDVSGSTCKKRPAASKCSSGAELMADKEHCCWPGQAWSRSAAACVGEGRCPDGSTASGGRCNGFSAMAELAAAERAAGIEWVRIPAGTFQMGSNNGERNEQPVHSVRVSSFELMKTEVTFGQYNQCVSAGACTPAHTSDGTCTLRFSPRLKALPSSFQGDDQPAVCVDWSQAQAFANWVGGRLPTEAEWEYAARSGGKAWTYPWGDEEATCSRAIMYNGSGADGFGCRQERTWPVCSKPAGNSTQGVCDLAGNVWEWVQDDYHDSYSGAPGDGRAWEAGASSRVVRGGSWFNAPSLLRASFRTGLDPSYRSGEFGFRLAR